jgi:hypothetical protein
VSVGGRENMERQEITETEVSGELC